MAIGTVVFYPSGLWGAGYDVTAEPSIVTQNYASSDGETTGAAYDLVDAKRTSQITIDTNGESQDFQIDFDLTTSITDCNFCIIDNHNLGDTNGGSSFQYGSGPSTVSYSAHYGGELGSALAAESSSVRGDYQNSNDMSLTLFTAVTDDEFNIVLYYPDGDTWQVDVVLGEIFWGKSFAPSTAPEQPKFIPGWSGVKSKRTAGGQNNTHKRYGKRMAWQLEWSYVSESDIDEFIRVFNDTEGHRYPFYIDLGEAATPQLYFVRLKEGSFKYNKLAASAYKVSLTVESEV